MQILKVISLLLDYPTEALQGARDELNEAIGRAREISPEQRSALIELVEQRYGPTREQERHRASPLLLAGAGCKRSGFLVDRQVVAEIGLAGDLAVVALMVVFHLDLDEVQRDAFHRS